MKRLSWALLPLASILGACAAPSPTVTVSEAVTKAPPPGQMWQQGRSTGMASSPLAPVAGKNTVTPTAEIPLSKLQMPPGFKAEVWASGLPGGRAMTRGDNGKIYVGTRGLGRVYEVSDTGSSRTVRTVVDKLNQPSGVAYLNGSLYVMAIDKVLRFDGIATNPNAAPVDMTAAFKLPTEQHHNWKYIAFGPDGKLYVPFGAPCNICELPSAEYAQIRRYNPDGSGMEVLGRGIRNSVGFDWHPVTKELWFSNHGRDWLGDHTPNDTLHRMRTAGLNYGFPYCHEGNMADPDVKKAGACDGVEPPVALMGPHVASMGVFFYTGNMFPPQYKNTLLNARKGSWNRNTKSGYDVVAVNVDADGKNAKVEPFISGFLNPSDQSFFGRPVYFMQLADGSVLLSDEQMGAIYRISYSKP